MGKFGIDTSEPYAANGAFCEDVLTLADLRISLYNGAALETYEDGRYRFKGAVTQIGDVCGLPSRNDDYRLSDGYAEGAATVRTFWERMECKLASRGGGAVPFARVMRESGLDGFEAHCVLLAFACELDEKYERVFGLLRDDLTVYLPSIALAERLYEQPLPKQSAAYLLDERFTRLFERTDTGKRSDLSRELKLEARLREFLLSDSTDAPPEYPLFGGLAQKVTSRVAWDGLILPPEPKRMLRQACMQAMHARTVYESWGFGRKTGMKAGISLLFTGPPGTGKTLAASVIASELGRELYKIDLPAVVSKYIGETEKNLKEIFDGARENEAVLLFDEADALFGKRTEIKDSHDRNANLGVSYLLQRMDEFEGVMILTTNYQRNIDEAFRRRLNCIVAFPQPDRESRVLLWNAMLPQEAPGVPELDIEALSGIEMSGSAIRGASVAAAFLAAAEGSEITMRRMAEAVAAELSKSGKMMSREQRDIFL